MNLTGMPTMSCNMNLTNSIERAYQGQDNSNMMTSKKTLEQELNHIAAMKAK